MLGVLKRGLDADVSVRQLTRELAHDDDRLADDDHLEHLAGVLAEVVRRVPDALGRVLALAKDERCGRAVAFAAGPILSCVLDPDDLLPESDDSQLGLLDDAYLVHTFAARLADTYPFIDAGIGGTRVDAGSLDVVAALLPDGVAHALARTSETVILVAQALFAPGADGRADDEEVQPEMRVAAALRALEGVNEGEGAVGR